MNRTLRCPLIVSLAMVLGLACGDDNNTVAPGAGPVCPGTGGVVFALKGSLTSASPPFTLTDKISGCMRVKAAAATANTTSTSAADVIAYTFTIGAETWSGTGTDFLGIFKFTISADARMLSFKNAGGQPVSVPGMYPLDIVTTGSNPTEWAVGQPPASIVARAVGTMGFSR